MFEDENVNESDVQEQSAVSSEPQDESQQEGLDGQESKQAAPQKEVPFHEHPRWKEVMEERNAEREARKQLEAQISELRKLQESQLKPKDTDPMYERLKGIDPDFAEYLKEVKTQAMAAKQLQEELAALKQEQFTNTARATFSELNAANKVSPELAKIYEQQLEAAYSRGEFKDVNGLKAVYKNIHDTFTKVFEDHKRSSLAEYTEAKKKEAAKPAPQAKGKAPSSNPQKPMTRDQLVKSITSQLRASKEV